MSQILDRMKLGLCEVLGTTVPGFILAMVINNYKREKIVRHSPLDLNMGLFFFD